MELKTIGSYCAAGLLTVGLAAPAWGQTVTATTVGEVLTGEVDDDLRFANAQGSANNNFAAYIALEFPTTDFAGLTEVPVIEVSLFQADAFFSTTGEIGLWLTEDNTTDIAPITSALRADPSVSPTAIAAGDLAPLTLLGTLLYDEANDDGFANTFSVTPDEAVESYILGQIDAGQPVRFVVAANEETTSATFAGIANDSISAPTLTIPEPTAAAALLGLGAAVLGGRGRRRA